MNYYKITYKNGNTAFMQAYSVEEHDDKFYVCGKSYACDNPEWYTLTKNNIASIDQVYKYDGCF